MLGNRKRLLASQMILDIELMKDIHFLYRQAKDSNNAYEGGYVDGMQEVLMRNGDRYRNLKINNREEKCLTCNVRAELCEVCEKDYKLKGADAIFYGK